MDEKKIQELMEDEKFVKELVELKTKEEVQELFKLKGLEISMEELNNLEEEGKGLLPDSELENVSGGVKMRTRIASCVVALLPLCPAIQVEAVSAQMPSQGGASNVSKTQKAKDWIKKNPKKSIAVALAAAGATGVAIYKHVEQSKKDDALISAAWRSKWDDVKALVAEGANVNARDNRGNTALIRHTYVGRLEIVEWLVEHGADVNAMNDDGETALSEAIRGGRFYIIQYLVEHGANVNAKPVGRTHSTLVGASHWYASPEMMSYLVERGADVNGKDNDGRTALITMGGFVGDYLFENVCKSAAILVEHGADVNAKDIHGRTALIEAAGTRNLALVKFLVEQGADVNAKDIHGRTALIEAAGTGNSEIVKYLVEHGANVNAKSQAGKNAPLILTTFERGLIDPTNHRVENMTALIYAAINGNYDIVRYLVENGADVNATSRYVATSLMDEGLYDANTNSHQFNASVRNINGNEMTALNYAELRNFGKIVQFLREHGAT